MVSPDKIAGKQWVTQRDQGARHERVSDRLPTAYRIPACQALIVERWMLRKAGSSDDAGTFRLQREHAAAGWPPSAAPRPGRAAARCQVPARG